MTGMQDETRMVRKQYHLSAQHVRRIEALRAELGVSSDAEVIRRAIDTFDADALGREERDLVEATAADLRRGIERLNERIADTLERTREARERLNDPGWIESIRERTRREVEADPALVGAVAQMIGA
jgi:hypothetical protein